MNNIDKLTEVTHVGLNQQEFITSCWQLAGVLGLAVAVCIGIYWFWYQRD